MNIRCAVLIVAILTLCPAYLFAQQDTSPPPGGFKDFPNPQTPLTPVPSTKQPSVSYDPKTEALIPYKTSTSLREPETGMSVGVFGGVTAFQNGTLNISSPSVPGVQINGTTQNRVGGVAGVKFEYTWAHFMSDPNSTEPALLMPSIEEVLFWTGYNYKATDATFGTGSSLTADVNTINFMIDPKLNFQLGIFRPYIGLGIGATYVTASNAKVNVPGLGTAQLTGSSNDIDFSVAGLAGVEVFIARNWALSLDYRYQYILDPTFHGTVLGADVKYHLSGLGGHLFTAGLNYYF